MMDNAIADAAAYVIYVNYEQIAEDFLSAPTPAEIMTAVAVINDLLLDVGYPPSAEISNMVLDNLGDPLWRMKQDIFIRMVQDAMP